MNFFRSKRPKPHKESSTTAGATAASSITDDQNQSGYGLTIEYFQIQFLLDCLMRLTYNSTSHSELIGMCYQQLNGNEKELEVLNEFDEKYSPNQALSWYLRDCFLYKIINYTLESQDIRNLFYFRGILRDIKQQIEQHKSSTPLHVYRVQLMPMELLDKWISSVGQCIVINSFLSTTTNENVVQSFLNINQTRENYEKVLIEIDADPRVLGAKPFVQTGSLNHSSDKHEVLFMFGSIFLINNITCDNDGLYRVELTLYSDNDNEFKQVFNDMKDKYGNKEFSFLTFSQVLYDLDRFDEAEEYTNRYLESLPPEHEDSIRCYNMFGSIALAKGDFETSLQWYNKTLEYLMRKSPTAVDPKAAEAHENLGDVYLKQGLYDPALKHYLTSLEIKSTCLPAQHPLIASTFENIGRVYELKRDISRAIAYFQKASAIYRAYSSLHDKLIQIEERIKRISHH